MSSKINSKDIINKQKEKFQDSPWFEFLSQQFDLPEFDTYLNKLIESVQQSKPFTPALGKWFADFDTHRIEKLKVVFVAKDNSYLDHFYNIESRDEIIDLEEQGVWFYELSRTKLNGSSQVDEWRMFNIMFIDRLLSVRNDLVFVFVGNAKEYAGMISNVKGSKIFLPESDHIVWDQYSAPLAENLFFNINSMLSSKEIETIEW